MSSCQQTQQFHLLPNMAIFPSEFNPPGDTLVLSPKNDFALQSYASHGSKCGEDFFFFISMRLNVCRFLVLSLYQLISSSLFHARQSSKMFSELVRSRHLPQRGFSSKPKDACQKKTRTMTCPDEERDGEIECELSERLARVYRYVSPCN